MNDGSLDGKFLGIITSDFIKVADALKEASHLIRTKNYSKYPIFPISVEHISVGQLLYTAKDHQLRFNYSATYLDEFVQRGLIDEDKVDKFVETYKNPDEFCCLFMVAPQFTNFIFVPYPED